MFRSLLSFSSGNNSNWYSAQEITNECEVDVDVRIYISVDSDLTICWPRTNPLRRRITNYRIWWWCWTTTKRMTNMRFRYELCSFLILSLSLLSPTAGKRTDRMRHNFLNKLLFLAIFWTRSLRIKRKSTTAKRKRKLKLNSLLRW